MTPQLHTELNALIDRFFTSELTDEEWAVLQVHVAYSDSCEGIFLSRQRLSQLNGASGEPSVERPASPAGLPFSL